MVALLKCILFSSFLGVTSSLVCYVCFYADFNLIKGDKDCYDPIDTSGLETTDRDQFGDECRFCVKQFVVNSAEMAYRGCIHNQTFGIRDTCVHNVFGYVSTAECLCETDFCNTASNLQSKWALTSFVCLLLSHIVREI